MDTPLTRPSNLAAAPPTGVGLSISPGVVRVIAPNPSPMTHWGTNTYLLGTRRIMIIDPGPGLPAHFDALLTALAGREVSQIVVTHAHLDHSALASRLAVATGAPVAAFGPARSGRSKVMTALAEAGLVGGGEGIDTAFSPDVVLCDGQVVSDGETAIEVLHTPGHLGGHLCLRYESTLFSGDHVMGWAPSLISPPDGDLTDFMTSCTRLRADLPPGTTALPGHGAPIADLAARLDVLIDHRRTREAQIRAALDLAPGTATEIAARVYTDIDPLLLPAAARNVLAHLVDLTQRSLAYGEGPVRADTTFSAP